MDQSIQVIVLGRSTTFPLPSQLPTPGIFKSSCCFFSSPEGHIRPLDRCNAQFGKFGARSRWPRGRRSPRCRLCMDDAASLSGLICTFLACLQKFVGEGVFVISWMRVDTWGFNEVKCCQSYTYVDVPSHLTCDLIE